MKTNTNINGTETTKTPKLRNRSGQAVARETETKTVNPTGCKSEQSQPENVPHGTISPVTGDEDLAVYFEGPEPERNKDGDEIPFWPVFVAQDCGQNLRSRVYYCSSYQTGERLARAMAHDRKLDLVIEAQPS